MFNTVQETIDRLAATLSQSVSLLDADYALVSNSRHFNDIDDLQLGLLAERVLDLGYVAKVNSARGGQRHTSFLLERDSGMQRELPRVFFPLRSPRSGHGHLCITLSRRLTPSECATILETAKLLLHLVERTSQSILDANETIEIEVLGLLSEDESLRAEAAGTLLDLGMFPQNRQFVTLCLRTSTAWTNTTGPPPQEIISRVLYRAITAPAIHSYTFVPTSPEAFVLIGFAKEPTKESLQSIVQNIVRELRSEAEAAPIVGRVGVGGTVAALEAVWQSYEQARIATDIARVKGLTHVFWSDEGIAASAFTFIASPAEPHLVPDIVLRLESASSELIELFEVYFELSGNVAKVADRLHMHRSTVYNRLARSAASLGMDFEDGDSRFLIQAWLMQRRFYYIADDSKGTEL